MTVHRYIFVAGLLTAAFINSSALADQNSRTQRTPSVSDRSQDLPGRRVSQPQSGPAVQSNTIGALAFQELQEMKVYLCNRTYSITRTITRDCPSGSGSQVETLECTVYGSGVFPSCRDREDCRVIDVDDHNCAKGEFVVFTDDDGGDDHTGDDDAGSDGDN